MIAKPESDEPRGEQDVVNKGNKDRDEDKGVQQ